MLKMLQYKHRAEENCSPPNATLRQCQTIILQRQTMITSQPTRNQREVNYGLGYVLTYTILTILLSRHTHLIKRLRSLRRRLRGGTRRRSIWPQRSRVLRWRHRQPSRRIRRIPPRNRAADLRPRTRSRRRLRRPSSLLVEVRIAVRVLHGGEGLPLCWQRFVLSAWSLHAIATVVWWSREAYVEARRLLLELWWRHWCGGLMYWRFRAAEARSGGLAVAWHACWAGSDTWAGGGSSSWV